MHDFLRTLARFRPSPVIRYGSPLLAVMLMTLLRLVAPLDAAPFLLFMPVIFLTALALGRGAALAGLILSTVLAAYFFVRGEAVWQLSPGEVIALIQYLVVGGAMILICGSLRQAFVDNEITVSRLNEANGFLERSREHLEAARKEAEDARESAERANRTKSEFLANMSHELRTPLSAIIGYSEMMQEEIEDGGDTAALAPDITKIEGNARHLLGLINDVLDLSKVESGKMEVYAEDFDVETILKDLVATVGSLISKKSNTLDLRTEHSLGLMHSDLTKVRQVLLNLLSNAAKFTEAGTITLTATRQEAAGGVDQIAFSVSDTGVGMTEDQLAKLFQRFQQADSSTTRKFGGTGLGLSLTKAFADMLGGSVSVDSTAGKGSTFTLVLPAVHVPTPEEEGSPVPDEGDDGRDLILVIDDDEDQRILTTRFLHREGFRVQVAASGRLGLNLAKTLRPRAILLDVMMPGIDGWSVLSALKADLELSEIPVVMVTAVDQRSLADALGAADYMLKPVDWARFSEVMDRFHTGEAVQKGQVLLVEDDAIIRKSVQSALEDAGWQVVEAANGREGVDRATVTPPQVVLVDLNMPVMDGFTFLSEFRALPGCAETPVIVLTGRSLTAEDRRKLRGATQVLNMGNLNANGLVEKLKHLTGTRPHRPNEDLVEQVAHP